MKVEELRRERIVGALGRHARDLDLHVMALGKFRRLIAIRSSAIM
jgi:hypothetical protein